MVDTRCYRCFGSRMVTETRTEDDFAMGLALGTALDMGYFPSTNTVTERVPCPACRGTGDR